MTAKEKWIFLHKLHCPSNAVVICDASEVFGGSEDLEEFEPKRAWEDLEHAFQKTTHHAYTATSPEALVVTRLPDADEKLDPGKHAFVYGRIRDSRLVELRIVLDPYLDGLS